MARTFSSLLRALRPLSREDKENIETLKEIVGLPMANEAKGYLREQKIGISYTELGVSHGLVEDEGFPQVQLGTDDVEVIRFVDKINGYIIEKVKLRAFREFSEHAIELVPKYIASNIVGFTIVKDAVALQLFSNERTHILLLGDPGTGKTAILHAAAELSPISTSGLGSGTSGAGLVATLDGKEVAPGLLPMADGGLCTIDELNLMKQRDYAGLYNAMEKGFVSYDKSKKHVRFDARVRILATANPTGDKFVGRSPDILKKQLPFDAALLSRFHLVFMMRRPSLERFKQITQKIVSRDSAVKNLSDYRFIREYIEYAEKIESVDFPKSFEKQVVDFTSELKREENKFLIEISPRLVVGIIRLTKASARQELRKEAKQKDLERVFEIIRTSLFVRE